MNPKILQLIALTAAICTALVGQANLIGEPWIHSLSIIGIVASTVVAFYMQPPRNNDARDRISDSSLTDISKKNN